MSAMSSFRRSEQAYLDNINLDNNNLNNNLFLEMQIKTQININFQKK